jgi:hypothetical protein
MVLSGSDQHRPIDLVGECLNLFAQSLSKVIASGFPSVQPGRGANYLMVFSTISGNKILTLPIFSRFFK